MMREPCRDTPCNIVIIGASGDLTRRKLLPALFSLYCNDLLPRQFAIFGFARTSMDDAEFRTAVMSNLTCRYEPEASKCQQRMEAFLSRCFYQAGGYASADAFAALRSRLETAHEEAADTLIYMAIPSSLYVASAESLGRAGLSRPSTADNWTRVVLEKPFGRDGASSRTLMRGLNRIFDEQQVYRIDHYLGKELVQNLMVLRFANIIFEPVWNRSYVDHVSIFWGETIGCEGRAGYFDRYGIIRDVVQNHLLQMLALVAMEPPISLDADRITDEKVKLLRCVEPFRLQRVVTGQYAGYRDDPGVPSDSRTATYMRGVLAVNNPRWYGVPFRLEAGKAIDRHLTEIQIHFKKVPYSVFAATGPIAGNHMIIRVQPNEALELHLVHKEPGLNFALRDADLNLLYHERFDAIVPDAYERLLLDVRRGERSLFLRDDELDLCWQVVDPLLSELAENQRQPVVYPHGSPGPPLA